MKKIILLSAILCSTFQLFAQKQWFSLYQDSTELMRDAKIITENFINDIKVIDPTLNLPIKSVLNTTPYLIYYNDIILTANLPLWEQVIPQQKSFFYEVAGNEDQGKIAFGLFFNGFYLPHELGHALQDAAKDKATGLSYQNEYLANTIAMLWWKKHNRNKELKLCYEYAKKMHAKLPNPVPSDMNEETFFTMNYEKATQNPYVYGYMQFKQFIQIYEDKSLSNFDNYIKKYLQGVKEN